MLAWLRLGLLRLFSGRIGNAGGSKDAASLSVYLPPSMPILVLKQTA